MKLVVYFLLLANAYGLSDELKAHIQSQRDTTEMIINHAIFGAAGQSFNKLSSFVNAVGPRFAGTEGLEKGVDYMAQALAADGLENVRVEPVMVPTWVRGLESARLLVDGNGTEFRLDILSYGGSVGTPPEGIIAEVVVVRTFDEFEAMRPLIPGKIVLWDYFCDWKAEPTGCYGQSVPYRQAGAPLVQEAGGLASLVRAVGPREGPDVPHTGGGGVPSIPNVSLSHSSTDYIAYLANQGIPFRLHLSMEAHTEPDSLSHNVVAEIVGSEFPDEYIVFGGHIDSWDVGQGAMDDGGGCVISWQALSIMRQLDIRPRRTIRVVMWTNEEFGLSGAHAFFEKHGHLADQHSLVMESDLGTFEALGIQFTGSAEATEIMEEIGQHLESINTSLVTGGGGGADIGPWMDAGVPGASLANSNERYFFYHHTRVDRMEYTQVPYHMDLCSATWAVTAWAVADLPDLLPR